MLSSMGLSSVRNWRTFPMPMPRDDFHQHMMFSPPCVAAKQLELQLTLPFSTDFSNPHSEEGFQN